MCVDFRTLNKYVVRAHDSDEYHRRKFRGIETGI